VFVKIIKNYWNAKKQQWTEYCAYLHAASDSADNVIGRGGLGSGISFVGLNMKKLTKKSELTGNTNYEIGTKVLSHLSFGETS
jgi:hypothetical protein